MTALSADVIRQQWSEGPMPPVIRAQMKTGETFYKGSLVCIDTTTGYAVVGSTATTLIPLGVYLGDTITNSGSSGAEVVDVHTGVFRFANSSAGDLIAVTEIGQNCYITDDNTVAKTDGTGTKSQAGTIIDVDIAGVWVCVGPYPIPGATYVTLTGTQVLTNKTLTTPTIASFVNATHTHAAAASGGQITPSAAFAAAVPATLGGTGQTTTTAGDLLYGAAGNTISKLGIGTAKQVLATNAGATAPEWVNTLDSAKKGVIQVPLASFVDADGDPIVKFNNGVADGFTIVDSKAMVYRVNDNASPPVIMTSVAMPDDLDDTAAIEIHALVSKSSNTLADAVTLTFACYFQEPAALHDADTNCGGATNALVGNAAAKTVTELIRSIAHGDVPASPSSMTMTMKVTDGTLGTDDAYIHSVWIEYTKKVAA